MNSPPYLHSQPGSRYASPAPSQWSGDQYPVQWVGDAYPGHHHHHHPGAAVYGPFGSPSPAHAQPQQYGSPSMHAVMRGNSTPPTSSYSPADSPSERKSRRTPPSKKKKNKSDVPKPEMPDLEAPLSVLTKDMHDVPVRDMAAWVNRPVEERHEETKKRQNRVARPMNSFMLYRSAYAERTKRWCTQNNHQVVSRVSGKSWPMEPAEIRNMFNELSKIERDNHQLAYPGYKFSPSKGPVASSRKRKDQSEDEEDDVDSDDDNADPSYRPSRGNRRRAARPDSVVSSQSATPELDSYSPYIGLAPGIVPYPLAQATNPLIDHGYNGYYEQPGHVNLNGNMHDAHFMRQAYPTYMQSQQHHLHQQAQQPIVGLPAASLHDLLDENDDLGGFNPAHIDPELMAGASDMYYPEGQGTATTANPFSEHNFRRLDQDMIADIEASMGSDNLQSWEPSAPSEVELDFERIMRGE